MRLRIMICLLCVSGCLPSIWSKVIRIEGTSDLAQLNSALAEAFQKEVPSVTIEVHAGGTSTGIKSLSKGECDIVAYNRRVTDEERLLIESGTGKRGLEHRLGLESLSVLVNIENPAESITPIQLAQMISRGDGSWNSSFPSFDRKQVFVLGAGQRSDHGLLSQWGLSLSPPVRIAETVLTTPGIAEAINYVENNLDAFTVAPGAYRSEKVKELRFRDPETGVLITSALPDLASGRYPLSRTLGYLALERSDPTVEAFLTWTKGTLAKGIIAKEGFTQPPPGATAAKSESTDIVSSGDAAKTGASRWLGWVLGVGIILVALLVLYKKRR